MRDGPPLAHRRDLALLIHRVAEKSHYTPFIQGVRPKWPVAKNAMAENVEPTDRPGFSELPRIAMNKKG